MLSVFGQGLEGRAEAVNSQSLPTLHLCRPSWSRSPGQWVLEVKTHGGDRKGKGAKNGLLYGPTISPSAQLLYPQAFSGAKRV